jgi:branched-chain amino acid transport system ATP-binding protein
LLRTTNLEKRFGGLVAVSNVTFQLRKGELTAIIGPNGAGKTTFFNLVAGVLSSTSGEIYFNDERITKLPSYKRVEKGIVKTCQIVSVFNNLSVLQNIILALQFRRVRKWRQKYLGRWNRKDLIDRAQDILERVGLLSERDKKVASLPIGHKKRLEIALAISSDPTLLMLDEPTAGLSTGESKEIISCIRGLTKEMTVLLVEHKMYVVMDLADRIVVMHKGQIIADGKPVEIEKNQLVRQVYLGAKAHVT